jgi:hypothetical protein
MPSNSVCRHAIAFGLCTICMSLPVAGSRLETPPDTVAAITGSNHPTPENDNPNDPAGGQFFQQPIASYVSSTFIADRAFISTTSGLIPFKPK